MADVASCDDPVHLESGGGEQVIDDSDARVGWSVSTGQTRCNVGEFDGDIHPQHQTEDVHRPTDAFGANTAEHLRSNGGHAHDHVGASSPKEKLGGQIVAVEDVDEDVASDQHRHSVRTTLATALRGR